LAFREGPFQDLRVPLTWTGAVAAVVAIAIALAVLFVDRQEAPGVGDYGAVRSQFDQALEPVAGVLAAPVRWIRQGAEFAGGYFFAVSENRRLRQEVVELEGWRDAAIALKNINTRYEALLELRTEPPIPMVSARVVADARGPFSHARLADAGSDRGVMVGNPVLSERGVVGRVIGVTRGASRVLLLTDVDSRTPVLVDRTNSRAILTGDGGPAPRLDYLRGQEPVQDGDLILTSGDGGIYPRGLPVGVAVRDARGVWRVRLYSDQSAIDYVRILVFNDFTQMVDQAELARAPLPPLSEAERAAVEAAAAGRTGPLLSLPQPAPTPAPAPTPSAPAPRPAVPPAQPAPTPAPAPVQPPPATLEGLF